MTNHPPPLCSLVTTIQDLRTGKIRPLGATGLRSAIFKASSEEAIAVGPLGLDGDEQQYALHGGVDKALHQYCVDHYETWKLENPTRAHLFKAGAFGENIVTSGLNEKNICIGDLFRIGDEVLVQISEPRQPCYKLSHRFEWKKASMRTQQTGMTGWYLRVIESGYIKKGDTMQLIGRPHPRWTIQKTQEVLYGTKQDPEEIRTLGDLPELGEEIKKLLEDRLTGGVEDMSNRLQGIEGKNRINVMWQDYTIVGIQAETQRVKTIDLKATEDAEGGQSLALSRFAHVMVRFGPEKQLIRTYSVVSGNRRDFQLAIALDDNSRGGSRYIHESLSIGDSVEVSVLKSTYETPSTYHYNKHAKHIFIIGGIGITAFLGEIYELQKRNIPFEVHYAVRSEQDAAFLSQLPPKETTVYPKTLGQRLKIADVIPPLDASSSNVSPKIFCCGPTAMMHNCKTEAKRKGYVDEDLHFEDFGIATGQRIKGEQFMVEIEGSEKKVEVGPETTLLNALIDAGFETSSSCLTGNCGMCVVDYSEGDVIHNGNALSTEEQSSSLLTCVSRAKGLLKIRV